MSIHFLYNFQYEHYFFINLDLDLPTAVMNVGVAPRQIGGVHTLTFPGFIWRGAGRYRRNDKAPTQRLGRSFVIGAAS